MKNLAKDPIVQVDGKFYEKCQVVILPIKGHSNIISLGDKLHFNTSMAYTYKDSDEVYHLYILSNEEIKEGDWVLDKYEVVSEDLKIASKQRISKLMSIKEIESIEPTTSFGFDMGYCNAKKTIYEFITYSGQTYFSETLKGFKKIIATTDGSLGLSRPSDEFLKKFCELNGIKEVLVQVIQEYDKVSCETGEGIEIYYRLKLATDNTITIKPVPKDKLYTRDEVEILLKRAFGVSGSTGCYLDRE